MNKHTLLLNKPVVNISSTYLLINVLLILCFLLFIFSINFAFSQKIDSTKLLIIDSLNNEGIIIVKQDPHQAILIFQQAIEKSQQIKYIKGEIKSFIGMSKAEWTINNKTLALELLQKAQTLAESISDREAVFDCLIQVGNIHQREKNYALAYRYFENAGKIADELKSPSSRAIVYHSKGSNECFQLHFEQAIVYYMEALHLFEELKDSAQMIRPLLNLGVSFAGISKFEEARRYLEKCLDLALLTKDNRNTCAVYISLSDIYNDEQNYVNAIKELQKALAMAVKMDDLTLKADCYQRIADAYSKAGNYPKAYENHKMYADINSRLFSSQSNEAINEMEVRFQTEKKEQKIKTLSQENQIKDLRLERNRIWLVALGGLALALVAGFFLLVSVIRQNRLKEQQEKIMLEQRLLRSQMNPHFIFNSLISIQSFVLKNDSKEAGRYLTKFSRLMRMVLEHSRMEYVPLDKEIEWLNHYLELQVLRFENMFDYSLETDPDILTGYYLIPPMLAQPFIENSIEHGLSKLNRKGHVSIKFNLEADTILFMVEDNGVGLNQPVHNGNIKSHKSFASQITKERLALLNKGKKSKIEFRIENIGGVDTEISGTRTVFSIPFMAVPYNG